MAREKKPVHKVQMTEGKLFQNPPFYCWWEYKKDNSTIIPRQTAVGHKNRENRFLYPLCKNPLFFKVLTSRATHSPVGYFVLGCRPISLTQKIAGSA